MDFRDEFRNYPELFPGDPFLLIEIKEKLHLNIKKMKEEDLREVEYQMKKRNITIDITRKKDEYMYNYLMSTLKKSMLAYDPKQYIGSIELCNLLIRVIFLVPDFTIFLYNLVHYI
jgi:hypothetical protein